nr:prominin-2-like [Lytechinus pictus]
MWEFIEGTRRPGRQNVQSGVVLVIITVFVFMTAYPAKAALADDAHIRNERGVVFSDQGNILYDNGTLVFDAAMRNDDIDVYLIDDMDYEWEGIGDRAAGWVREGVVRAVPPSKVIALLKKHLADDFDVPSTVKETLNVEMPVIITSFMLITMAILMPLVGIIFCCCRCAGKCGGTRKDEDLVAMGTKGGIIVCSLLLIVCAFIGTLSYLTTPSIIRMVDTVEHTSTMANNILEDIETFKDDFIQDLNQVGVDDLGFVTGAVYTKLDAVGEEVASPLLLETAPYLNDLSDSVENLGLELASFTSNGSTLDLLLQTSLNLVSAGQSLLDALDVAKNDMTTIRDDCLADPLRVLSGACGGIPDPSILDTSSIDFSTIDIGVVDLDDLRNEMQSALATIRDLIDTGNETLQDVPELIANTSVTSIDEIRDAVSQLQEEVEELINETSQSLNEVFDSLHFDTLKETIDTTVQIPVEKNVTDMIASLVPVLLSFMVILTGLGLLIALAGLRCNNGPDSRGCGCDCGGKMLMGSVCWSFSISLLICLLAAIFLILGCTLTIVCDSLIDLSLIQEVVDDPEVWGGSPITDRFSFGNSTFNVTVYEILENCGEDATLFNALELGSSGLLDVVNDMDIREMLPDLTSVYELVNRTVSGLDVLPSDDANVLLSQLTSQLSPSNITGAIEEMQLGLDQFALTNLSDALNTGADAVVGSFPAMASSLHDLADDLQSINDQQLQLTLNLTVRQ